MPSPTPDPESARRRAQFGRRTTGWGRISGYVVAVVTAPLAYWIGTRQQAEAGYILSLFAIGGMVVYCICIWLHRESRRLKRQASRFEPGRDFQFESRIAEFCPLDPAPGPTTQERVESWLNTFDNKKKIITLLGRLMCGMGCIGAGIVILVASHGERPWGGSVLLSSGGLLLGAPTLLDRFKPRSKPPSKRPRKPR